MKTLLIFLVLFTLSSSSLGAQELDLEMQQIREASPQERVKLMNQLKRRIAKMNQNERADAINKLRAQTANKQQNRKNINNQQFDNSHESFNNQSNNQRQAGNGYMKNRENLDPQLPRF